jgi:hypothetical protein
MHPKINTILCRHQSDLEDGLTEPSWSVSAVVQKNDVGKFNKRRHPSMHRAGGITGHATTMNQTLDFLVVATVLYGIFLALWIEHQLEEVSSYIIEFVSFYTKLYSHQPLVGVK